ncbi:MAG: DUF1176 domain-containing protein [Leptolyngbyaceae cyanobacterium bins.302]|nr:DUF1176 domain-containing protein [Leptolyngbyaceae cyanobacterium bins.302]
MKINVILLASCFGLINMAASLLPMGLSQAQTVTSEKATPQEIQAVAYLLKNSKQFNVCTDSLERASAQEFSRAYQVSNQTYLVMIQCFLGAYQGAYQFFLYAPTAKSNTVKPLRLTRFDQNEAGKIEKTESLEVGGLPTYEPKQRLLTVETRFRGVGDCGSIARYRVEKNALKLIDYKAKFVCDGKVDPYQQIFPPK